MLPEVQKKVVIEKIQKKKVVENPELEQPIEVLLSQENPFRVTESKPA